MFGEKKSDVKLHMEDGMITGVIHLPEETYHIEVIHLILFSFPREGNWHEVTAKT